MRLLSATNLLILGTLSSSEHQPEKLQVSEGRQFSSLDYGQGNGYFYPSKDRVKDFLHSKQNPFSHQQQQQQKQQQQEQQQFPIFKPIRQDYYEESFNEVDGEDEHQDNSLMERRDRVLEKDSTKTSPALSAIALLGFLYFLNLIQNVLQGTSTGRKKREVEEYLKGTENIGDYLLSIEDLIKKVSDMLPTSENEVRGRSMNDVLSYFLGGPSNGGQSEERAFRMFSYLGSLISKIPQALGFGDRASQRNDEYLQSYSDESNEGFWSMFGSKIGLMAKIMDFLNDPKPSRVGRSQYENEVTDMDPNGDYAVPLELSDEDKLFLPSFAKENTYSRKKRFAEDEMNIWYSEAEDKQRDHDQDGSEKILGMVFNLFKQALTS